MTNGDKLVKAIQEKDWEAFRKIVGRMDDDCCPNRSCDSSKCLECIGKYMAQDNTTPMPELKKRNVCSSQGS